MITAIDKGRCVPGTRLVAISSLILVVLMCSCGTTRQMRGEIVQARDSLAGNFVQAKGGMVVKGDTLAVRYPFFQKGYVEINQQEREKLQDIAVMQNDLGYYRTLEDGLAPRIKKGGVNMYLAYRVTHEREYLDKGSGNGMTSKGQWKKQTKWARVYYIQQADTGRPVLFNPMVVSGWVSDYQPAKKMMQEYYTKRKQIRVMTWVDIGAIVGGVAIASISNNDAVSSAGFGLFLGGLVNSCLNWGRRAKNVKRVERTIDVYNCGYNHVEKSGSRH